MTRVRAGQLVAIPISNHGFALAHVLWLSHRFRNVALIGVFPGLRASASALPESDRPFVSLLYTGSQPISRGIWPVVGLLPLHTGDGHLSLRRVAAQVYLADEAVRLATPEDESQLPEMDVLGAAAASLKIARVLGAA
jgi:hypothetical protein